jgi:hypothetical protein
MKRSSGWSGGSLFSRIMFGLLPVLIGYQDAMGQETAGAISTLERLAVRAAVERHVGSLTPGHRVAIDPMVVYADEAPGDRNVGRRDASRHAALTKELGARTLPRDSVIDCSSRPCQLREIDVYATLAEPVITGSTAKVTVTTLLQTNTRRGMQYVTVNVLFEKQGTTWKVAGFEQLGVS